MEDNPLKTERLKRNLTQKQLARLAEVSQNAVVKYEHGLYKNPSTSIISALHAWDLIHLKDCLLYEDYLYQISYRYRVWRLEKLRSARSYLASGRYYGGLPRPDGLHPFADWRLNYLNLESQMDLCKLLVLHPSIVSQYEAGRTRNIPTDVKITLTACSVPVITIEALDIEGALFHDSL